MTPKKKQKQTAQSQGTSLEELHLQGLTALQQRRLEASWIVTAEGLLSMSATPENRRRLALYLNMPLAQLEALLADVRPQLGLTGPQEAELSEAEQPSETREARPKRNPKQKDKGKSQDTPLPLQELERQPLSPQQLRSLRELGVTMAEELISMGAISATRQRLASYLHMSQGELEAVLAEVRAQLDPEVVADMQRPVPGGFRGGVLDPIPEEKRRGRRPALGKTNLGN